MKRALSLLGLSILLLLGWCGKGHTLSVTLVEDPSIRIGRTGSPSKQPIVLQFGSQRVVVHDKSLPVKGASLTDSDVALSKLFLVRDLRAVSKRTEYEMIYQHGPFRLVILQDPNVLAGANQVGIRPVTRSMVVTQTGKGLKTRASTSIQTLLSKIDRTRYGKYLSMLAGASDLPTRYACSSTSSVAYDRIVEAFEKIGLDGLVTNQSFPIPSESCQWNCEQKSGFNIIGQITGKTRPNDYYVVGAHYDSITDETDPCKLAPGANDNASGVAGVLELATVFNEFTTDASIIFAAFDAEELDIYGSKKYVNELVKAGKEGNVKGFIVLDMISYYKTGQKIYVEGGNKTASQKSAVDTIVMNTSTYTDLEVEFSYDFESAGRGNSDHVPFLKAQMPGALIIEWDSSTYEYLHTSEDKVNYQKLAYAVEVLKVAAATLAQAGVKIQAKSVGQ